MKHHNKFSISNLNKSFDGRLVLRNLSFDIKEGQSLVVIGGSGSGKSVMLKSILGIIMPDYGSKILVDGHDVSRIHIKDRYEFIEKFGMLFQGGALFDSLPIWHNICFHMLHRNQISKDRARSIAIDKLRLVDITADKIDFYPSQLSGGMQKRIALARAIANNPSVIFFDEPTAGLDPINAQAISELIASFSRNLKATTVTITHDMACMKKIADSVIMLHQGAISWKGSKEMIKSSDNDILRAFIKAARVSL